MIMMIIFDDDDDDAVAKAILNNLASNQYLLTLINLLTFTSL